MKPLENPLAPRATRFAYFGLGGFRVGVVVVTTTLLFLSRPGVGSSAGPQLLGFLLCGLLWIAIIPYFLKLTRGGMPAFVEVVDDRIIGWSPAARDDPDLVILFADVRRLSDLRTVNFPLFPTPTVFSRRPRDGTGVRKLTVEGTLSPEGFTLTPEIFDQAVVSLKRWRAAHADAPELSCYPPELARLFGATPLPVSRA